MKKNKVLAVALSAGLVFSGAYLANSNINVAYASESQPTKEELEAKITQLKNERVKIDSKKAQSVNAINWREHNRKVSDLSEEKLKQYEIWDENARKVIEECDSQMLELDNQIASIQEQIKALENSPTPGEGNPGNGSTEADKAKALEDYKKKYSDKIDDLSDLTEEEKQAAKEEIANATSEAEVDKAYNNANLKNQEAKSEREKKEEFAKAKEDAKKEIDAYGDKLTEKDKESYKQQIDKAPTKGAIAGILEEAKKASEKEPEPENPQEPETPTVDEDYKDMFLENLLSLSKLTDEEKEDFKEKIEKAKTNGEIYDIYNEAIKLNNSRNKKPENPQEPENPQDSEIPTIDEDYKDMFLDNLLSLSKLTDEEKDAFKERIEKAKTNGEIYDIYNEAIKLNNSRNKKPENPQDPETPTIDADYKDMFLENLLSLSKLTDEEKEAFKERIEKAKTNGEIYDIYNEAVVLNNSRDKKPEKPVDPVQPEEPEGPDDPQDPENPSDPTEPIDPSTPTEPAEPSKPENPSHDNDDYLIIPPAITNPSTTEVVKDDVIYVPKGYAHIKEGFYKKSDLIDRHNRLRKAVKENRIQVKAAEFLLEYTPKTVASVKDKLINLIEKSNKLVKKGKDVLEEYDQILGLDDKCYAL